jgi:hypothetical protein
VEADEAWVTAADILKTSSRHHHNSHRNLAAKWAKAGIVAQVT